MAPPGTDLPDAHAHAAEVPPSRTPDRGAASENRFYRRLGALTLLLASVPYLWGWLITPPGQVYTGFAANNIDDTAVYLAWMRQAEDGHFFLRNQFSIEPQRGVLFNLFFWLLGIITRVTHLPAIAVYHGARVVCGALLLWAVTALLRETLADPRARRAAFALVCVSSGFGWFWRERDPTRQPVDLWQPEAITFLSLYYSPLFVAALALMVVFFVSMLRAERSGRARDIWPAAVSGALLGNFHSYDVIHLFAVWSAYRLATDVGARRVDRGGWIRLILVGLAALPTTLYQAWALSVEPGFYERAFLSATWSPRLGWILLGYGLPLALATGLLARRALLRRDGRGGSAPVSPPPPDFVDAAALRFLATWAVVGIAVAYVPVAFQRKLLMGAHLPLCALAGAALAQITGRRGNAPRLGNAALAAVILLTIPSNVWFLGRDMNRLVENTGATPHRPRLTRGEWEALLWLRRNTRPGDAVLVASDPASHRRFPGVALYPHLSVYVPALAGNAVYNGHWAETRRFREKLALATRFFATDTDDGFRRDLLRRNGIRYVLFVNALGGTELTLPRPAGGPFVFRAVPWPASPPPPYLRAVFANDDITVYAVEAP
jgi:hypothetical protein